VNRSQNELTPGSQKKETKAKEVERREKKNIREGAKEGGKDEDLQTQIVEDLRRELASAKTELSMRKIADKIGISPETLYKVQNGLVEYNK
jgi:ribosome-binding protein aMBF1 (putative translation factor)